MNPIRPADARDAARLAEIEIFNYRLNFYPIFGDDSFYFGELSVPAMAKHYTENEALLRNTFVYDDGVVKGFARMDGHELCKLFVEPLLQGQGIGAALLAHAVEQCGASELWALERNEGALRFYARHGFQPMGEWKYEEDTAERLIRLKRI